MAERADETIRGSWETRDSNTKGRPRERRTNEIQGSLERLQSMSGAHTARDVFINPVDTVSGTMLAASSHDRNNDPESDHITIAIGVHTAFLHADVDQDLFAEQPPEPDEWYDTRLKEDEVWRLNKALYAYRKAPTLWHQHLESILESLNYHPLLTDPSCFRNDETNTYIVIHADDGLLFGPRSELLNLVELL